VSLSLGCWTVRETHPGPATITGQGSDTPFGGVYTNASSSTVVSSSTTGIRTTLNVDSMSGERQGRGEGVVA
jgi:hypothetical protein